DLEAAEVEFGIGHAEFEGEAQRDPVREEEEPLVVLRRAEAAHGEAGLPLRAGLEAEREAAVPPLAAVVEPRHHLLVLEGDLGLEEVARFGLSHLDAAEGEVEA